jgi:hypothetical protein
MPAYCAAGVICGLSILSWVFIIAVVELLAAF